MASTNDVEIDLSGKMAPDEREQVTRDVIITASEPPPHCDYVEHSCLHWIPKWDDVKEGLSLSEAHRRLANYGPNALPEKKTNALIKYLRNYWGPMPIMIWAAIFLILGKTLVAQETGEGSTSWLDFIMCCVLQFVNANVKWYNGRNADNAIKALKDKMAPTSIVKRDGEWATMAAKDIVPGDVIQIRIGDIIAADCRAGLVDNLQCDQAALTGESLPSSKKNGDLCYAGTVVKRGDGEAVVVATGCFTEMGRAASMVGKSKPKSRYDFILFWVAMYLLVLSLSLMTIQFIKMSVFDCDDDEPVACNVLGTMSVVVLILVGALRAYRLSEHRAVVSELTSVEELSGMSILCSDKTGTLTQNKLHIILDKTVSFGDCTTEDLMFYSGIACRRIEDGQDAIDFCITQNCKKWNNNDELWNKMSEHPTTKFTPFHPDIKRTEATIEGPDGETFRVCKGAPQVVLELSENKAEIEKQCVDNINSLAHAGYRTLGVARGSTDGKWTMLGLLAIADPPRHDTKEVVEKAKALGIKVLMITDDQLAIAKEVGKQVGIGDNMLPAGLLKDVIENEDGVDPELVESFPDVIERCDGFAEPIYADAIFAKSERELDSKSDDVNVEDKIEAAITADATTEKAKNKNKKGIMSKVAGIFKRNEIKVEKAKNKNKKGIMSKVAGIFKRNEIKVDDVKVEEKIEAASAADKPVTAEATTEKAKKKGIMSKVAA